MENEEYNGRRIRLNLASLEEQDMWDNINKLKESNPDLFKIHTGNNEPLGKISIISTLGEIDSDSYKKMWDIKSNEYENYKGYVGYFNPSTGSYFIQPNINPLDYETKDL